MGSWVELWCIGWEGVEGARMERWVKREAFLSFQELERARGYRRRERRWEFMCGRSLLKVLLARHLGVAPQEVELLEGREGKPYLGVGGHVGVSHSGGYCLVAFSPDFPLGVDLERIRFDLELERMMRRFFSPLEREYLEGLELEEQRGVFFQIWTYKEAWGKFLGRGLNLAELRKYSLGKEGLGVFCRGRSWIQEGRWIYPLSLASPWLRGTLVSGGEVERWRVWEGSLEEWWARYGFREGGRDWLEVIK
ncbi:MAG: 4'-phosphopantetheinyl transferase superfamily protein [Planctomycetota bacterium]|nr:MAG: 4'-phosphopantetheinyl transferase superfamily protein [Planctomycetota bacterium]